MSASAHRAAEAYSPAPYGRACAPCARAKTKCFYRPEGSTCERCHRLGKSCQPTASVRKRKGRESRSPSPPPTRLEKKLDDLVTILRSQAAGKTPTPGTRTEWHSGAAMEGGGQTHHTTSTAGSSGVYAEGTTITTMLSERNPSALADVAFDASSNTLQLLRPDTPQSSIQESLPILADVSIHRVPEVQADEQLEWFRRVFIPVFPFVYLPPGLKSAELRHHNPFLWLVVMALTPRSTKQVYHMEETIWRIISQRVVAQQFIDMDLLLGVVAFGAWSHHFKKDKPFVNMLSQLAVTLAFDLGLHQDVAETRRRRGNTTGPMAINQETPTNHIRTLEERRTILAVFHLASTAWTTYRKIEPPRWTTYLSECVEVLSEGAETSSDILLTVQIRCQLIVNQLIRPPTEESELDNRSHSIHGNQALLSALLRELGGIRKGLPPDILQDRIAQSYLDSTDLRIREAIILNPRPNLSTQSYYASAPAPAPAASVVSPSTTTTTPYSAPTPTSLSRLDSLQTLLIKTATFLHPYKVPASVPMPASVAWGGISVDTFGQLLHALVLLFRLSTLTSEPGWDNAMARQQTMDVFTVLDELVNTCLEIHRELDIREDADTPQTKMRKGLFQKAVIIFKIIKSLFQAEMTERLRGEAAATNTETGYGGGSGDGGVGVGDGNGDDPFAWMGQMPGQEFDFGAMSFNLIMDEPWLADMFQFD